MYKFLFPFCLFLVLIGCNCDECIKCEGLSAPAVQLLDSKIGGSTFTNGTDSTMHFEQNSYSKSVTYMADCFEDLYSGACNCESENICGGIRGNKGHQFAIPLLITESRATSRSWIVTDSSGTYRKDSTWYNDYINTYDIYDINYYESSMNFNFLDARFYASLIQEQGSLVFKSDSIQSDQVWLSNYTTPANSYTDVIEISNPKQFTSQASLFFTKIYIERLNGVIAFESKAGDLFYLSN